MIQESSSNFLQDSQSEIASHSVHPAETLDNQKVQIQKKKNKPQLIYNPKSGQ